jgi:hypothetical protein
VDRAKNELKKVGLDLDDLEKMDMEKIMEVAGFIVGNVQATDKETVLVNDVFSSIILYNFRKYTQQADRSL